MSAREETLGLRQIGLLLSGEADSANRWVKERDFQRDLLCVLLIVAGTGAYGASMGCWRAPLQAFYTAVKFPMIVLLTALGNGILNGMLAPLLGVNINFRQSLQAVLMSFTMLAAILGAFSPLLAFLVWNAPPLAEGNSNVYFFMLVAHVAVIAFAGVTSNLRLWQLLERLGGGASAGRRVLFAWLAGNFLLGSQLAWILRPFIGSPALPVEFVRQNAFSGSFYESVLFSLKKLSGI